MRFTLVSLISLLLIQSLNTANSFALALCSPQTTTPATFSVDSVLVKQPGDTEFREITTSNFCYSLFDTAVDTAGSLHFYNVVLGTRVTSLTPDLPDGSIFQIKITNTDTSRRLGLVSAVADETQAVYGDTVGGSENEITISVKSIDPNINLSCMRNTYGIIANSVYVAAVSKSDPTNYSLLRTIYSKSVLNPVGLPEIRYDSEAVSFSLMYPFYGCRTEGRAFDSLLDGFFPNSQLVKSGLSIDILNYLDDEMLPLLFTASSSDKMKVSLFKVERSFGERESLDGLPKSTIPTGLNIRMEMINDGWSDMSSVNALSLVNVSKKSGGFSIKPSARAAIRACSSKKKMKKGHSFKIKGKNLICAAKKKAQRK